MIRLFAGREPLRLAFEPGTLGLPMDPIAKVLITLGIVLVLAGVAWHFGWLQTLRLGRLPGDIVIERENFRFYFPLATGILLSVILTLLSWLLRR